MKITVLGSASGISMPGRGHASVALETGGALYLFDLGEPVGREMLARGLPIESLRTAFISHMHADHVGGLFQMVKNLHLYHNHPEYLPQVERITLALPEEAVEAVKAFFTATYSFPERMAVEVNYLPVVEGPVYEDDCISVVAYPSTHLEGYRDFLAENPQYRGPRCEAFSYGIHAEGKRVLYSGDLGGVDDILGVVKGADALILEFGHLLPLEENLKRLRNLDMGRVILTHIFPDYSDRTRELEKTAERALPGLVSVAVDGLEVEV